MTEQQKAYARGIILGALSSGCITLDDIFQRTGENTSDNGVDEMLQIMLKNGELRKEGGLCADGGPVRFYLVCSGN